MSKFLLIGSIAAMLYGDCAWGMGDDIDPWKGTSSGAGQFNAEPARGDASPNIRSRRNSTTFSRDAQTQTEQSQFEQSWSGQAHANPQQLQENRFIKDNGYRQYHYAPSNNSKIGRATPTTIISVTDDLKCWNDISEIRYANDVSYDKLENPKVILYRNKDNSCYIILRTDDRKKYGVFYGINERNVEIGRQSFAVYEVSEDVGSFTDGVPRRIYVDESGLYFVPKAENSVEDVIKTYQSEGKFNFKGSVIKVSAIDGSITLDDAPVTEDNFFDNWVLDEIETERQISQRGGKTVTEKVKKTEQVPSTKQPGKKEILRNFYPPKGKYEILKGKYQNIYLNAFSETSMSIFGRSTTILNFISTNLTLLNFKGTEWLNFFIINKGFSPKKADDRKVAEQLVRKGIFALISPIPKDYYLTQRMYKKVEAWKGYIGSSFQETIRNNSALFRNLDFVRSLKPELSEIDKGYEYAKESGLLLPFEIVRNL